MRAWHQLAEGVGEEGQYLLSLQGEPIGELPGDLVEVCLGGGAVQGRLAHRGGRLQLQVDLTNAAGRDTGRQLILFPTPRHLWARWREEGQPLPSPLQVERLEDLDQGSLEARLVKAEQDRDHLARQVGELEEQLRAVAPLARRWIELQQERRAANAGRAAEAE